MGRLEGGIMIAAIYARKSTEQNGVGDEEKSVTRQIEHAKVYAARKGWLVEDNHVYVDDGISGAEFVKRPGFIRLMNALSPRPPFQVLVMSEESRLGREQIETAYALKQITDAGVRVFFYLEDRERTLDNAMDKVMLSLTNFAAEMEREKARQRTYDAMLRKAKALHVTGGKVYGYDNVEILGPDGSRASVARRINEEQAAVIRRIFELYAGGTGTLTIAHRLNEEGVKPPRGRGWAPSGIREMLYRSLYRGEIVWNRSQKIVRAGTKKQRMRDKSEWLTIPAPDLRIISDDLWLRVAERLQRSRAIYARTSGGRLLSRPRHRDESAYLLTGFARCAVCGGTIGTDLRAHGSAGSRAHVPHYGCLDHKRRGAAVCTNAVGLNQGLLDPAILAAICALLDEHVLGTAVDRAFSRLTAGVQEQRERKATVERELGAIQIRIERLLDALADGSLPKDEVAGRLNAEKSRKDALTVERDRLTSVLRATDIDAARLKAELLVKVQDVKALLGRHIPQARQMLRKLLADKIELEPVGQGRKRGYKFRGALTVDRLIAGDTLTQGEVNNTSEGGGPNGNGTRV
jgi:DNA invertase Pin-like site-specific DNA recombinase